MRCQKMNTNIDILNNVWDILILCLNTRKTLNEQKWKQVLNHKKKFPKKRNQFFYEFDIQMIW